MMTVTKFNADAVLQTLQKHLKLQKSHKFAFRSFVYFDLSCNMHVDQEFEF